MGARYRLVAMPFAIPLSLTEIRRSWFGKLTFGPDDSGRGSKLRNMRGVKRKSPASQFGVLNRAFARRIPDGAIKTIAEDFQLETHAELGSTLLHLGDPGAGKFRRRPPLKSGHIFYGGHQAGGVFRERRVVDL